VALQKLMASRQFAKRIAHLTTGHDVLILFLTTMSGISNQQIALNSAVQSCSEVNIDGTYDCSGWQDLCC
jgi:hypothetical protein